KPSMVRKSPASCALVPSRKPARPPSGRRGSMTHRATLAGVSLGRGFPAAVMGALNVSPESFHAGSIHTEGADLVAAAASMVDAGAVLIDVGARSTAPYGTTAVSEADERGRLRRAVGGQGTQRSHTGPPAT